MIIVMKPDATKENIQKVEERLHQVGLKAHLSTGEDCTIIGVIGDRKKIANLEVSMLEGVEKTVRITEKYKLVSRHFHPEDTIVDVDGVKIGGKEVVVMAGPCSVESIGVKLPRLSRPAGRSSCAAVRSSRARARTTSRGLPKKASRCCAR